MPEERSYISKVKLSSNGGDYYIKDLEAREAIEKLSNATHFLGKTTTSISDGSTTNPITINNEEVTAVSGDIVFSDSNTSTNGQHTEKEYIFNGTFWQEFGSTGTLGNASYSNFATGNPSNVGTTASAGSANTISRGDHVHSISLATGDNNGQVKIAGSNVSVKGLASLAYKSSVSATYTPAGSVPVTVTEDSTNGNITVATGTVSSAGSFTGDKFNITGSFSGTSTAYSSADYTPAGSVPVTVTQTSTNKNLTIVSDVAAPTFTGNKYKIEASFSGTKANISTTVKPEGSINVTLNTPSGSVTGITSVGSASSMPQSIFSVTNETLVFDVSQYVASVPPSADTSKTFLTGASVATKTFTGTSKAYTSADYTPAGSVPVTVTQITGSATGENLTVGGSISKPTLTNTDYKIAASFSGTKANISTTVQPAGSVTINVAKITDGSTYNLQVSGTQGSPTLATKKYKVAASFSGTQATITSS